MLIDIAVQLKQMNYDINLTIVGPDWKNLIPALKEKAKSGGISGQVNFTGLVSEERIREILSTTDIFVSASEYEGFGISAVEAMASGTLCVLNDIPSFHKFLKDKPYGRTSKFRDVESTAKIIAGFIDLDDNLYADLSDQARAYAMEFDWNEVSKKITAVY